MDVTLKSSSVFRKEIEVFRSAWVYLYGSICDYEMYIPGSMTLKVFSKLNNSMFLYTQIGARAHTQKLMYSFCLETDSKQGSKTLPSFSQSGLRTDSAVSFLVAGRGTQGD